MSSPDKGRQFDRIIAHEPVLQQPSDKLSNEKRNELRKKIGQSPLVEGDRSFTDMRRASLKKRKKSKRRKHSKRTKYSKKRKSTKKHRRSKRR